jgi:hypothetical protein
MSDKKTAESQKQQSKRQKTAAETGYDLDQSQSAQEMIASQAGGLPGLPDHPTAKTIRQAAVLQLQRRHGNRFSVQKIARSQNGISAARHSIAPPLQREEVSAASVYERISDDAVYETLAHEMVYEDELSSDQRQTLRELGFRPRPLVTDPVSDFQMRGFMPLDNEAGSDRTPVLAFRGSESIQDVIDDLNERGVGALQMRRNLNSIMDEMERLGGRVIVTGHSLGGALAQMAAALFPSRVVRVVTFQSPGIPSDMLDQLNRYNESVPEDQRIQSDHYQAEGGIIDAAGQAFTPGTITVLPTDLVSLGSVIGGFIGSMAGPAGSAAGFTGGRAVSAHTSFIVHRLQELRRDDPDEFRELMLEVHQVNNGDSRPIESIRSTLGVDRSD